MNFNFGDVLSRAWQIIWKHKVLWIFGILASCSQGGVRFNAGSSGRGNGGPGPGPTLPPGLERLLENLVQHITAFIAITVAVACIFWIVAIFLGTIGRIGLIRGAWQVEGGAEHLVFGQLFSESTPYFWRIFGLSLIVGLPFLIFFGALVAALVAFAISVTRGNNASAFGFLGIPVFLFCICLLIPIAFVVGMIVRQAERVIVLENSPVLPSLSRGWDIFRNNLGPIIVMAVILFVLAFVVSFIIALPIFIIAVPAMIAYIAGNGQSWTPLIIVGVLFCLYIPIAWFLNGILVSYTEAAWTLTYMRLTGKPSSTDVVTPEGGSPPGPANSDATKISSSNA